MEIRTVPEPTPGPGPGEVKEVIQIHLLTWREVK